MLILTLKTLGTCILANGGKVGIEEYFKEKKEVVNREMENLFPREIDEKWLESVMGKADYAYDTETLTEGMAAPIWNFLDRGGKRWRPALMLLCNEACNGNAKDAEPFTVLPELMHSGTIAVDDIEDNSKLRRGKPCMHLIYGTDVAINDANAMYFLPLILLYRNRPKLDAGTKAKVYDLYAQEMLKVSMGQAMDIWWHHGKKFDVSENEYLQMVVYKTGVLARFSAKLGAVLAGADEKTVEALGKFGEAIGVGFQIQDDILNLMPVSQEWGKEVGEDITEGKRTMLVIHALKKLNEGEGKRLVEILNKHTENADEIKEVIGFIKKTGAVDYARERAGEIVSGAWNTVEKVIPESSAKKLLKEFADFAVERKM